MEIWASDVARATGGTLHGEDVQVDGATADSRDLRPGQLFVPLVAERDGHDFLAAAAAAGAGATLASRPVETTLPVVRVDDTAAALMDLATWARGLIAARVVGVTGSVGKTSTKDLVRAAVGARLRVTANEHSYNNEQGLPVTVLGAPADAEALVLEMGMRGFGEITRLCEIGRPEIGVVTAVAPSHTERVGDLDGVARAKAELVQALPPSGTAVLNGDDARVAAMAAQTEASVLTYGSGSGADVRIGELVLDDRARARFRLHTPWGDVGVRLGVSGAHMAHNAAAAVAVAGALGVDLEAAADALSQARLSAMRMELIPAVAGGLVVNDAYNANPTSTTAALDALAAIAAERRIAVLGEMAELSDPVGGHREVAARAAALGIELMAVGTDLYGVPVIDVEEVRRRIGPVAAGTAVLIKASKALRLELRLAELADELVG